jgi:hypothetical protein
MCDILVICIRERGKSQYSVAPDAAMSGFPRIRIKNQKCAPIQNVIAPIGKNRVKLSKRKWFEIRPQTILKLNGRRKA